MDDGPLLLAIDGGQTATKALLARTNGQVLGAGLGGPSDHFHTEGGLEKNRRAIVGAIDDALATTGCAADRIVAACLGSTGAPAGGPGAELAFGILHDRLPNSRVRTVPDYVTNLAGASAGEPGVVLIAGGGAIGYGITADGREALSGGYGYLLGDEGSAFDIGLRAIAAACRGDDLRGEPTALQTVVKDHFGVARIRDLPTVIYAAGFSRERISLLSPKVVQTAQQGDLVAIAILRTAGEELALTGLGVIRQLFEPGTPVGIYMTGGAFQAGPLLLEPFRARLRQSWPAAEARYPRFPPAVGGLILAARLADIQIDSAWLDTTAATLPSAQRPPQ